MPLTIHPLRSKTIAPPPHTQSHHHLSTITATTVTSVSPHKPQHSEANKRIKRLKKRHILQSLPQQSPKSILSSDGIAVIGNIAPDPSYFRTAHHYPTIVPHNALKHHCVPGVSLYRRKTCKIRPTPSPLPRLPPSFLVSSHQIFSQHITASLHTSIHRLISTTAQAKPPTTAQTIGLLSNSPNIDRIHLSFPSHPHSPLFQTQSCPQSDELRHDHPSSAASETNTAPHSSQPTTEILSTQYFRPLNTTPTTSRHNIRTVPRKRSKANPQIDPTIRSQLPRYPLVQQEFTQTRYRIPAYRALKPHRPIIVDLARTTFTIQPLKCLYRLQTNLLNPTYQSNNFSIYVSAPLWSGDPLQLRRHVTLDLTNRSDHNYNHPARPSARSVLNKVRTTIRKHNYINHKIVGANVLFGTKVTKMMCESAVERHIIKRKIQAAFATVLPQLCSPLLFCDIVVQPTVAVLLQSQKSLEAEVRVCVEHLLSQAKLDNRYIIAAVATQNGLNDLVNPNAADNVPSSFDLNEDPQKSQNKDEYDENIVKGTEKFDTAIHERRHYADEKDYTVFNPLSHLPGFGDAVQKGQIHPQQLRGSSSKRQVLNYVELGGYEIAHSGHTSNRQLEQYIQHLNSKMGQTGTSPPPQLTTLQTKLFQSDAYHVYKQDSLNQLKGMENETPRRNHHIYPNKLPIFYIHPLWIDTSLAAPEQDGVLATHDERTRIRGHGEKLKKHIKSSEDIPDDKNNKSSEFSNDDPHTDTQQPREYITPRVSSHLVHDAPALTLPPKSKRMLPLPGTATVPSETHSKSSEFTAKLRQELVTRYRKLREQNFPNQPWNDEDEKKLQSMGVQFLLSIYNNRQIEQQALRVSDCYAVNTTLEPLRYNMTTVITQTHHSSQTTIKRVVVRHPLLPLPRQCAEEPGLLRDGRKLKTIPLFYSRYPSTYLLAFEELRRYKLAQARGLPYTILHEDGRVVSASNDPDMEHSPLPRTHPYLFYKKMPQLSFVQNSHYPQDSPCNSEDVHVVDTTAIPYPSHIPHNNTHSIYVDNITSHENLGITLPPLISTAPKIDGISIIDGDTKEIMQRHHHIAQNTPDTHPKNQKKLSKQQKFDQIFDLSYDSIIDSWSYSANTSSAINKAATPSKIKEPVYHTNIFDGFTRDITVPRGSGYFVGDNASTNTALLDYNASDLPTSGQLLTKLPTSHQNTHHPTLTQHRITIDAATHTLHHELPHKFLISSLTDTILSLYTPLDKITSLRTIHHHNTTTDHETDRQLQRLHTHIHTSIEKELYTEAIGAIQASLDAASASNRRLDQWRDHHISPGIIQYAEHAIYISKLLYSIMSLSTLDFTPRLDTYSIEYIKSYKSYNQNNVISQNNTIVNLYDWFAEQQTLLQKSLCKTQDGSSQFAAPWTKTAVVLGNANDLLFSQFNLQHNPIVQAASKFYISPENVVFFNDIMPQLANILNITTTHPVSALLEEMESDMQIFNSKKNNKDVNGEKGTKKSDISPVTLIQLMQSRMQLSLDSALNIIRHEYLNTYKNRAKNTQNMTLEDLPQQYIQTVMQVFGAVQWATSFLKTNMQLHQDHQIPTLLTIRDVFEATSRKIAALEPQKPVMTLQKVAENQELVIADYQYRINQKIDNSDKNSSDLPKNQQESSEIPPFSPYDPIENIQAPKKPFPDAAFDDVDRIYATKIPIELQSDILSTITQRNMVFKHNLESLNSPFDFSPNAQSPLAHSMWHPPDKNLYNSLSNNLTHALFTSMIDKVNTIAVNKHKAMVHKLIQHKRAEWDQYEAEYQRICNNISSLQRKLGYSSTPYAVSKSRCDITKHNPELHSQIVNNLNILLQQKADLEKKSVINTGIICPELSAYADAAVEGAELKALLAHMKASFPLEKDDFENPSEIKTIFDEISSQITANGKKQHELFAKCNNPADPVNVNNLNFSNPFPFPSSSTSQLNKQDINVDYDKKRTNFIKKYPFRVKRIGETPEYSHQRVAWECDMMKKFPHIFFYDGILINIDREIPPLPTLLDFTPIFNLIQQLEAISHEVLHNKYLQDAAFHGFVFSPKEKHRVKKFLSRILSPGGVGYATGNQGRSRVTVEFQQEDLPQRTVYDPVYEKILANHYSSSDRLVTKPNTLKKPHIYQNVGKMTNFEQISPDHTSNFVTPFTQHKKKNISYQRIFLSQRHPPSLRAAHVDKKTGAKLYHSIQQSIAAMKRSRAVSPLFKKDEHVGLKFTRNSHLLKTTLKELGVDTTIYNNSGLLQDFIASTMKTTIHNEQEFNILKRQTLAFKIQQQKLKSERNGQKSEKLSDKTKKYDKNDSDSDNSLFLSNPELTNPSTVNPYTGLALRKKPIYTDVIRDRHYSPTDGEIRALTMITSARTSLVQYKNRSVLLYRRLLQLKAAQKLKSNFVQKTQKSSKHDYKTNNCNDNTLKLDISSNPSITTLSFQLFNAMYQKPLTLVQKKEYKSTIFPKKPKPQILSKAIENNSKEVPSIPQTATKNPKKATMRTTDGRDTSNNPGLSVSSSRRRLETSKPSNNSSRKGASVPDHNPFFSRSYHLNNSANALFKFCRHTFLSSPQNTNSQLPTQESIQSAWQAFLPSTQLRSIYDIFYNTQLSTQTEGIVALQRNQAEFRSLCQNHINTLNPLQNYHKWKENVGYDDYLFANPHEIQRRTQKYFPNKKRSNILNSETSGHALARPHEFIYDKIRSAQFKHISAVYDHVFKSCYAEDENNAFSMRTSQFAAGADKSRLLKRHQPVNNIITSGTANDNNSIYGRLRSPKNALVNYNTLDFTPEEDESESAFIRTTMEISHPGNPHMSREMDELLTLLLNQHKLQHITDIAILFKKQLMELEPVQF